VGGFEEKLFIDFVDHEYCFKIKMAGHRILQTSSSILLHRIGEAKLEKLGLFVNLRNQSWRHKKILSNQKWIVLYKKYFFSSPYFAFLMLQSHCHFL